MVGSAARQGNILLAAVSGEAVVDEFAAVAAVYSPRGKGQVTDETPQHRNDMNGGIVVQSAWTSVILRGRMNRSRRLLSSCSALSASSSLIGLLPR